MSVRKRTWTVKGEQREAWVADYVDQDGERHIKTFAKRRDAEAFHANVNVEVAKGLHTADRRSLTIAEAGELWLQSCVAAGLSAPPWTPIAVTCTCTSIRCSAMCGCRN